MRSSSGAIGKEKYEALKLKELGEKLKKLDAQYPRLSTAMTLAESGENLPTHVRIRGNWTEKGEQVSPATPASLPPLQHGNDRLALAKWLVSRDNPLDGARHGQSVVAGIVRTRFGSDIRRFRDAKRKAYAS